jgi:hypothetical protein
MPLLGDICSDLERSAAWQIGSDRPEIAGMSDEFQPPPFVYEGLDPVRERKSIFAEVSELVQSAVSYFSDVIERGRKPGMPLSILSNVTREAPLASLLIAFVLGAALTRRRSRR